MLAIVLVLACLFGLTVFATRFYHQKQKALALRWFERGQADLNRGSSNQAIADFENSLLYARDNDVYRLSLAEALLANYEPEQARAHLLSLWSDNPESGTVNRELGRLSAREGDVPQAVRYYHNAIYGIWKFIGNPDQNRLQSRLELCQFLVDRNQKTLAEAELIALAGELPANPDLHAKVGDWFRRAGNNERALTEYRQALRLNPTEQNALIGAGETTFRLGDYHRARSYLERASRLTPQNTEVKQMLQVSKLVLSIDPLAARLSSVDRSQRVVTAFGSAFARLQVCAVRRGDSLYTKAPSNALESAYSSAARITPKVHRKILERDQDLLANVIDLIEEMENLTTSFCGAPTGLDEAIVLAMEKHGGTP